MVFIPNPDMAEELAADPDTRSAMRSVAEQVRPRVEANVRAAGGPWVPNKDGRPPVEVVEDEAGVHVVLTDHVGHLMEWGHRYKGPVAPLRRGVASAGLKLSEEPKS